METRSETQLTWVGKRVWRVGVAHGSVIPAPSRKFGNAKFSGYWKNQNGEFRKTAASYSRTNGDSNKWGFGLFFLTQKTKMGTHLFESVL